MLGVVVHTFNLSTWRDQGSLVYLRECLGSLGNSEVSLKGKGVERNPGSSCSSSSIPHQPSRNSLVQGLQITRILDIVKRKTLGQGIQVKIKHTIQ